jgi:hypothetical protein
MRRALALTGAFLPLLAGCPVADALPEGARYLSPLDGQSGWAADSPLTAYAEDLDIPADYPLPDLIRVVDLETGGVIAGDVERGSAWLRFTPQRPFRAGARYAWAVDVPPPVPHGPSLTLPEALRTPAVFDISERIDVLAVTREEDRRLCLVLSRVITEADLIGAWSLNTDGQAIAATAATVVARASWASAFERPEHDPLVDVLCFAAPAAPPVPPDDDDTEPPESPQRWPRVGETLRLSWGARGPWALPVLPGPFTDAIIDLRRGGR